MKSLRRIGRPEAARAARRSSSEPPKCGSVGEHRERRGAAALVGGADLGDVGSGGDLAGARRAPLELGDQRQPGSHQRLVERARVRSRAEPRAEVARAGPARLRRSTSSRAAPTSSSSLLIPTGYERLVGEPAPSAVVERDEPLEHPARRRPSRSRRWRARRRAARSSAAPPTRIAAPALSSDDVARRARLAAEDPAHDRGVLLGRAAGDLARAPRARCRGPPASRTTPRCRRPRPRSPGSRPAIAELVDPVLGADDERALAPRPTSASAIVSW